ncbi:hypothetical protein Plec18167_008971 [Paecilomyces lecythidis]|uniref:MHD domain-containing protein n=1 Tax=Paecilomyces lecythidis TaxID=3004212 RepID=A0ABR3WT53_9EURO
MSGAIEALYIYDEHNHPILEHVYRARPPSASTILPLYLAHPAPRPSLIYLPSTSPPVTVFSVVHSNLTFIVPSDVDTEPLLVLEFLHRVIDVLEEFVGAPLLSSKIQANYDVIAQLLVEMCDAGIVCNTEPNVLQETVEVPNWMGKLLGGVGLPGTASPSLGTPNPLKQSLSSTTANMAQGPAIPWRRPGVRHTSNELYVDIIESLSVTIAPSGRLLSALVSGTIAFTAKISGVPDLLLNLTTAGGQHIIAKKIELPVFHPCVRLARWRERPGELSFIPPDGRFILAGYEVNLLPIDPDLDTAPTHMEKLFLPAIVDIRKSLGATGQDFEVRLILNTNFPGSSSSKPAGGGFGRGGSGTSTPSFLGGAASGNSSAPVLDEVVVTVPIPKTVRNITDMRPSRGEAQYQPGDDVLEWRVPTKDAGTISGTATLYCTVVGNLPADEDVDEDIEFGNDPSTRATADAADANMLQGYYNADTYQTPSKPKKKKTKKTKSKKSRSAVATSTNTPDDSASPSSQTPPPPSATPNPAVQEQQQQSASLSLNPQQPRKTKAQLNAALMPTSASVSFSVRGWLPSGIKVDSLTIDTRRSRGLGEGVRPYKGVKYLCMSRRGVERRC